MHKSAWKIVDAFIEDSCPTWTSPDTASSKKRKRSSEDQAEADSAALAAQVLPWLQGTLAGFEPWHPAPELRTHHPLHEPDRGRCGDCVHAALPLGMGRQHLAQLFADRLLCGLT